jgi:hypothetical protein
MWGLLAASTLTVHGLWITRPTLAKIRLSVHMAKHRKSIRRWPKLAAIAAVLSALTSVTILPAASAVTPAPAPSCTSTECLWLLPDNNDWYEWSVPPNTSEIWLDVQSAAYFGQPGYRVRGRLSMSTNALLINFGGGAARVAIGSWTFFTVNPDPNWPYDVATSALVDVSEMPADGQVNAWVRITQVLAVSGPTAAPDAGATPTATATATATPTPTAEPSQMPTPTSTATPTPMATVTPTATPTAEPSTTDPLTSNNVTQPTPAPTASPEATVSSPTSTQSPNAEIPAPAPVPSMPPTQSPPQQVQPQPVVEPAVESEAEPTDKQESDLVVKSVEPSAVSPALADATAVTQHLQPQGSDLPEATSQGMDRNAATEQLWLAGTASSLATGLAVVGVQRLRKRGLRWVRQLKPRKLRLS